ncbi:MAG: hypothetical protein EOP51_26055 [Sphingobacteriales bacterium]|nr:MAG: hypothetical protein EOP51_26055 [Sphingobacteriales bacterium]
MKKLVLAFATVIACISAVNAQTQQQNGVLSGQKPLTPTQTETDRNRTSTPSTAPTNPQSVTPNATTPGSINTNPATTQPGTPVGSPSQPGNPPSPNTTNPGMPQNPSDRNIK